MSMSLVIYPNPTAARRDQVNTEFLDGLLSFPSSLSSCEVNDILPIVPPPIHHAPTRLYELV